MCNLLKMLFRRSEMFTYVRQRLMKSKNKTSVVFNAADSSLELGLLFFPLLLMMFLGFPLESAHS